MIYLDDAAQEKSFSLRWNDAYIVWEWDVGAGLVPALKNFTSWHKTNHYDTTKCQFI